MSEQSGLTLTEASYNAPRWHAPWWRIGAWSLFDFAMTMFSFVMLSTYFPAWITNELKQPDYYYTYAFSASMLVIAISSPALGAISDALQRRIPFLVFFVGLLTASVVALGLLSGSFDVNNRLVIGLILFCVANYAYQSTQIFFASLVAVLSSPQLRGRLAGISSGIGYGGSIGGLLIASQFIDKKNNIFSTSFIPTALVVFLFALPCLFLVKDQQIVKSRPLSTHVISDAFLQLYHSIIKARKIPDLWHYLIARILYADAAGTVVVIMATYVRIVGQFNEDEIFTLLAASAFSAIIGALAFGAFVDRIGPKLGLIIDLSLWVLGISIAIFNGSHDVFYIIGPIAGFALGGLRTCDRTFLVRVSPPDMISEAYGLFYLVGDASSVAGPFIFGTIVLVYTKYFNGALPSEDHVVQAMGNRIGLMGLLILLLAGFFLLRRAHDTDVNLQGQGTIGEDNLPAIAAAGADQI